MLGGIGVNQGGIPLDALATLLTTVGFHCVGLQKGSPCDCLSIDVICQP